MIFQTTSGDYFVADKNFSPTNDGSLVIAILERRITPIANAVGQHKQRSRYLRGTQENLK
jgi:hypothetical protein